jgi:peptidoglycan hydrolase CwlO-like protein
MKTTLPLLAAILGLGFASCTTAPNNKTNYAAVSVGPARTSVANAQSRVESAQARTKKSSAYVTAAKGKAKTATERIVQIEKLSKPAQPEIHSLALQVHADLDLLTQELLGALTENAELSTDLVETKASLTQATAQLVQVQKDNDQMVGLLNDSNRKLNAAIIQGAKDKSNAHKFKWIIIGLAVAAAGIGVFAIFGAAAFVPPLIYLTVGGPAAVGTFLFFYLGS